MNTAQIPLYQVVVIGNGPSGISLSNILSGNIPYFSGKIPSCYKKTEGTSVFEKCQRNPELSIIEQDLCYLSEGLDGRSDNPVAVLYDHLSQPNADFGFCEESALVWRHCPDQRRSHLVLGRGRYGGSWQLMQGAQLTVSVNNWLDLPGWTYYAWLKQHHLELKEAACSTCPLAKNAVSSEGQSYDRASSAHVAEYYERYVSKMGLEKNFDTNVTITCVKQVKDKRWEVSGVKKIKCSFMRKSCKKPFKVYAENVVLATGLSKAKRLAIEGESLDFVHHHVRKVVEFSGRLKANQKQSLDPVVVVGDGLSAADAVLELFAREIPVVHILRHNLNDEELMLNKLPAQVYHDYAKVRDMMCNPVYNKDGQCMYHAYPKSSLLSISRNRDCKIKTVDGKAYTQKVSAIFILIGSKPDLAFLKDLPPLGIDKTSDIDCRHNPIDIDPYTYECRSVKTLFALGPLVGDNFVRFGIGGAIGISSHLKSIYNQ